MANASLDLRTMPIRDLIAAPYNPRKPLKPGSPAYRKLETSLREFGLVEPLVWNELTGHVVGGHARLTILRASGVTEVPVSVVRLTPEREKALNVVLNNREAQGRFDPERLAELLAELEPLPELELTGFDGRDLANLRLEPLAELPSGEAAEGEIEVTLRMPPTVFDAIAADLDRWIAAHAIECHVKR